MRASSSGTRTVGIVQNKCSVVNPQGAGGGQRVQRCCGCDRKTCAAWQKRPVAPILRLGCLDGCMPTVRLPISGFTCCVRRGGPGTRQAGNRISHVHNLVGGVPPTRVRCSHRKHVCRNARTQPAARTQDSTLRPIAGTTQSARICARRGPRARNLWYILGKRSWGDAQPDRGPDLGKRLEPAIEYAERRPGSWAGTWT